MSAERIPDDADEPRWVDWQRAAIEAERETGRREETDEAAKSSLLIRVCRITAGTIVLLLGITMLVLPGPGLVVMAGGLSILSIDVPFASRLLSRVRSRLPQDADGAMPKWMIATMSVGLVGALVVSLAFVLVSP